MALRTMLLGHSICYWLREYLHSRKNSRLHSDFGVSHITDITFAGKRGHKIDDIMRQEMRVVNRYRPQVVVLVAGCNDLANDTTAEEIHCSQNVGDVHSTTQKVLG